MKWRVPVLILLLFTILVFGLRFYYSLRQKSNISDSRGGQELQSVLSSIGSSCKNDLVFKDTPSYVDYYKRLIFGFESDIVYDTSTNNFMSPSNIRFVIMPIDAIIVNTSEDRKISLDKTSRPPLCLTVFMEDGEGGGSVAYETKDGEIKMLQLKNFSINDLANSN